MCPSVESVVTNRANSVLVASSISATRYILFGPRSSSQAWTLVSHCTNSPRQLRRCRHTCICFTFRRLASHSPAWISSLRSVSRLISIWCSLLRYSLAKVGPKSLYWVLASFTIFLPILPSRARLDLRPRKPCITPASPFSRYRASSFRNPRSLILVCTAPRCWVRCPASTSCSTFSRSRSFCPNSSRSCSCANSHWHIFGLGTFYFALLGTSHIAVTDG